MGEQSDAWPRLRRKIGRADIEGSKRDVATNAWPPQASYPRGNFSVTSGFQRRNERRIDRPRFTSRIRTGNHSQAELLASSSHVRSRSSAELASGHLRYRLTNVPPQPNSPPHPPPRLTQASERIDPQGGTVLTPESPKAKLPLTNK